MVPAAYKTLHCSAHFRAHKRQPHRWLGGFLVGWGGEDNLYLSWSVEKMEEDAYADLDNAPHELRVAAACLCAGLMPPSVFADLLEDHRPDLAGAAAFLREWEQVHKDQQK